jgi:hypothetical protein
LSDQPRPARRFGQSRSRSHGVCPFGRARRGHPYNRRSRQHTPPTLTAKRVVARRPLGAVPTIPGSDCCVIRKVEGDTFSTQVWPGPPIARSEPSMLAIPMRLTHGTSREARRNSEGKTRNLFHSAPCDTPCAPCVKHPCRVKHPRPRDLCYPPSAPRPPGAQRQPQSLGPAVDRLGVFEQ